MEKLELRNIKDLYKLRIRQLSGYILSLIHICCVSMSAALAFMLHECGYSTVYVAHDSEHAWVELNGRVYDALFARAKDYNKYYNLSYSNFSCHPVDKRKI